MFPRPRLNPFFALFCFVFVVVVFVVVVVVVVFFLIINHSQVQFIPGNIENVSRRVDRPWVTTAKRLTNT